DDRLVLDVVRRIDGNRAGRGLHGTVHWYVSMIESLGRTARLGRDATRTTAVARAAAKPPRRAAGSNRARMRPPCTLLYSVVAAGSASPMGSSSGRPPETENRATSIAEYCAVNLESYTAASDCLHARIGDPASPRAD